MVVGIWMLTGCSSDDDKLDSLPWNDKELFNQSFVLNQDGYCILDGKAPVCDIDRNVLNSWLVSYGWQPVGIYQVKENGKLAKLIIVKASRIIVRRSMNSYLRIS